MREPWNLTPEEAVNADLIALFGGDGTMQITLSRLLDALPAAALPPLAILPFGTTNMNAKDLNRSQGRRATVASLARCIEGGQPETFTRPLVRAESGDRVEHGFFFGMGVIAEVVERWNEERKPGAFANQLRSVGAMMTGLTRASASLAVDVDGQPHSLYGLLATTLDRLLFGSRPYWGSGERDRLRITWVEATAAHLLRRAPALLRGRPELAAEPGYESRTVAGVSLDFDGPFIIDGEVFHHQGPLSLATSEPITWVKL
jgi:diacylglycerol kinase family enzyme